MPNRIIVKKDTVDKICSIIMEYSISGDDQQISRLGIKVARCLEDDEAFKDTPCAEDFRVARTSEQFKQATLRLHNLLRQ